MQIGQIELFCAITKHLEKKEGVKTMTPRQMNAVIAASNLVVAAMEQDFIPVTQGMTVSQWLGTDGVGASSSYVAWVRTGAGSSEYAYPRDHDDFGRIHKLLTHVSGMDNNVSCMRRTGPEWGKLVDIWPDLTSMYEAKQFQHMNLLMNSAFTEAKNDSR